MHLVMLHLTKLWELALGTMTLCVYLCQGVWQVLALPTWSPQSQPLIAALGTRIRRHNLQLLTRAYTVISVPKVAMLLGVPQAEAVQSKQTHQHPWLDFAAQMRDLD